MATRTATAKWNGTLPEGDGSMALGSGAFEGPFTYKSRFEEGSGTNPEELLGAALAGCYAMGLANILAQGGNRADSVDAEAKVQLRTSDEGPRISQIALTTRARVAGLDDATFQEAAQAAFQSCFVAKALAGPEITLEQATLEG